MKTIEQCKDEAAQEWLFDNWQYAVRNGSERDLNVITNRAMELCIEGERQRIMQALPKLGVHTLNAEYQELQRTEGGDYASGYDDGAHIYYERIISELKKQLTNK